MKRISIISFTLALVASFASCKKDEVVPEINYGTNYIINYGSYSGDKGEISVFNMEDTTISNGFYKSTNGVDLVSNIQYAYNTNGKIYFMGNNADQVFYVDEKTFEQTANGISGTDLVKPRYCVANGDILYVSCWGGDVWDDPNLSYITCIDLNTNTVVDKISLPGGPEGLAIAHGKLYIALNYVKKIAVMDLASEKISYITTQAVSSSFVKDKQENLYVSQLSTYTDPATEVGLGYINTLSDEFTLYNLADISATSYDNIMRFNKEQSKIYIATSKVISYNPYVTAGSIVIFNTNTKAFEATSLVSNITGLNGIAMHPESDDIFYFISESTTANGKMVQIKSDGTLVKEYETGIAPFMLITVK